MVKTVLIYIIYGYRTFRQDYFAKTETITPPASQALHET